MLPIPSPGVYLSCDAAGVSRFPVRIGSLAALGGVILRRAQNANQGQILLDGGTICSHGRVLVCALRALPGAEAGALRRHRVLVVAGLKEQQAATDRHG